MSATDHKRRKVDKSWTKYYFFFEMLKGEEKNQQNGTAFRCQLVDNIVRKCKKVDIALG